MATKTARGRVTGLAGVFVQSANPKALADWYARNLGIALEKWGGAILRYDQGVHPPAAVWNPYSGASDQAVPSRREFVIVFTVDDMDALLDRIQQNRVEVLARNDDDPNGRYAWVLDPDGTKIELWEPGQ